MTNYDITQWSDFVRGVASPEDERTMRELRDQDPKAARTAELLSRVQAVAEADMALEIPEYALRIVKAAASVARPAAEEIPNAKTWRFLSLETLFDSLMQPAMTGVRDMGMSHRQVSFQAEDYYLDVRWESDTGVLVGQLAGQGGEAAAPNVPVMMVAGGRIVERTTTSDLGEFQADGLPNESLELFVLVGEDACIAVSLDNDDA
jgi:hypothetical protein